MAEDPKDRLLEMYHQYTRRVDEIFRRSEEDEADRAEFAEEHERVDAWLSAPHWRTLDYDDARKDFVIPAGWPPGHVRKQNAPPTDEPPENSPPPDTALHRMLKEKQGR